MLQAILTHFAVGLFTLFIFVSFIYLALRRQKLSILFASDTSGKVFFSHPIGKENLYKVTRIGNNPSFLLNTPLREQRLPDLMRAVHTQDPEYLTELMKRKYPGLYTNKQVTDTVIMLCTALMWAREYNRPKEIDRAFGLIETYIECVNKYITIQSLPYDKGTTVLAEIRQKFSEQSVSRVLHRFKSTDEILVFVSQLYIPWK